MADYKFETLTFEKVTWTTPGGKAVEVVVALVQESTAYFGNGEWAPKRGGLNVTITTKVAGLTQPTDWVQAVKGHSEYTHRIGAVGMSAEHNAAVEAAYASIKKHPSWVAKVAREDKNLQSGCEYEAHNRAVNNMMQPGGSY